MNTQEQIESIVNQYLELLPVEDKNLLVKSEDKASRFLIAIAKLANLRNGLLNSKVKKESLQAVTFNEAIKTAEGKDAETRKAASRANPDYLSITEEVNIIDNQLLLVKTYIDIFTNSHLLYRALMKDNLNG